MTKIINLYHYEEEDGESLVQYGALCDGTVDDKFDARFFVGTIYHLLKNGKKPIVSIFLPEGDEMDRVVDEYTGEIKEKLNLAIVEAATLAASDVGKTIAVVEPEKNALVQANIEKVATIEKYADSFVIACADDAKKATNDISIIVKIEDEVDKERRKLADPPRLYFEHINSTFRSLLSGPLARAKENYNRKIIAWERKVKEDAKRIGDQNEFAVRQALAQANATGKPVVLPPLAQQPAAPPQKIRAELATGSVRVKRKWRWKLNDQGFPPSDAEIMEKLPERWKCPDKEKMDREVAKNERLTEADFNGLVEFVDDEKYQTIGRKAK
jgi:hypothetical protein